MAVRIISGVVAGLIAVAIFFLHNTLALPIAISLIVGLMLFELFRAVDCLKLYPASVAAIVYGLAVPMIYGTGAEKYKFTFQLVLIFAVFMTYIIKHKEIKADRVALILAMAFFIPESMATALKIEAMPHGIALMVLGLCGAWIADSGAYFTGTFLGKHKLCPEISPKKTVEGFIGGIAVTVIVFIAYNIVYTKFICKSGVGVNHLTVPLIAAACAIVGTIGDLSASLIKRQYGIKDYGNIMPGHGGAMDRFDSVLFVMPTFYAFLTLADFYVAK